jgi:hypothetical protein
MASPANAGAGYLAYEAATDGINHEEAFNGASAVGGGLASLSAAGGLASAATGATGAAAIGAAVGVSAAATLGGALVV